MGGDQGLLEASGDVPDAFLPDGEIRTTVGAIRQSIAAAVGVATQHARLEAMRTILFDSGAQVVRVAGGVDITIRITDEVFATLTRGLDAAARA